MADDLEIKILAANIKYHSALAKTYDAKQPHFLPENQARIDGILARLAAKTGGESLLDLGCGTGFIINIAKKYFRRIVGVDITQDMLDLVDTGGALVKVYKADTKDLTFLPAESFDVCTGYSFFHHLFDLKPTLLQAYRCLRPGGILYIDQDPNYHYWRLMKAIKDHRDLSGIVSREIRSVLNIPEELADGTNLSTVDVSMAEFQKVEKGGLDPDKVAGLMESVGFSAVQYRYEWFLGQGKVFHQQPPEEARVIEAYLREALPATRNLFKYISFYAQK